MFTQTRFLARLTEDGREQSLQNHTERTAALAACFAHAFGAEKLAKAAALYHDFGKGRAAFQEYMQHGGKSPGHSIYGAQEAYQLYRNCLPAAELLSNCIMAHHGRLRDFLSPDGEVPLLDRLSQQLPDSPDCAAFGDTISAQALLSEMRTLLEKAPDKAFALSMLTRLVYSCLVDADRLDAYLFESDTEYRPEQPDWAAMLACLERRLAGFFADSPIAVLRQSISNQCALSGLRERGIYQLSAPTGSGKTLSSLRFALTHAKKHGMGRIVYITPYLSILEQTAASIREALPGFEEAVLEHHSRILPDEEGYYKLHTDRWDSPIILSSMVQFLESVFSSRGSDLRKLHNMADSVIIFDEIQTLPVKCTHLFNSAINFLHRVCASTVLLCTATQPLLDQVERRVLLSATPSIADCGGFPERTRIQSALRPAGYSHEALAAFVLQKHRQSTLVIVNTKAAAAALVGALKEKGQTPWHLSTHMCPAHRDTVLSEIRRRLDPKNPMPVLCVSTQLIEAGVDLSCECVIRDIAGLDSIWQAAGRCNRHGEMGEVKDVFVVNIMGENLSKLPDIKIGADVTRRLFNDGTADMETYYKYYFHARKCEMDYPVEGGSIYDLLSRNAQGRGAYVNSGRQDRLEFCSAIDTAARHFCVIEPGQTGVVVPYGESGALLEEYFAADNVTQKRKLLRRLGQYTVSLYSFQVEALEKSGALSCRDGIWSLARGFYDSALGVTLNGHHEFLCV